MSGLRAEENVIPFDKPFGISVYGNLNVADFDDEYLSPQIWAIGLGLRYKSLGVQMALPVSSEDKSFTLQINLYYDKIYVESFYARYDEFVKERYKSVDLNILTTGMLAGWIHNNKNHSLSSIYSLDELQKTSSGSFLYGLGVFYTSIDTRDFSKFEGERRIVYFGPTAGYSYTWMFDHNIFVNAFANIGANAGIYLDKDKPLFVPQITPKIAIGHHHKSWSASFIGAFNYSRILWAGDDFDNLFTINLTLTFSQRF